MRFRPLALSVLLACAAPAMAQLSINFGSPGVNIGINLPVYPTLQRVPGYPVYYAPGVNTNYFFYDGLYWVLEGDTWYSSSWYNGPWRTVDRYYVPDYVLRVPVRYYRHAPAYFRGWRADAAPRWGDHWGASWEQRRSGWDRWNRSSAPAPAPLPTYQRQYSGNRYPQAVEQQSSIVTRNYRYQPQDSVAREQFQYHRSQVQSAPQPQPQPQPQMQQRRQQAQPQVQQQQQQQQAAPQPQAQQRRYQGQALPQQGQPQVKQQAAPQANPSARAPAPQPQNAPDRGNQGKGQERGKGDERGKGKGRDKDTQER